MPLRKLFIDMNAFFASVEQQDHPELRGRPVAVIPTDAATTACIAASYEAKRFGIRTGTPVWEARRLCPELVLRLADHRRYVVVHNRIVAAVESVLPVERVLSIDEMVCPLSGTERTPAAAIELTLRIKQAIRQRVGECLSCSIGIAPNAVLAKVAADMKKPDGLTVLRPEELPQALHQLQLQDFPGIGPRLERRLRLHGIFSVRQLCAAPASLLASVWRSKKIGLRWYQLLRGEELEEERTQRRTVSHSHVLPPPLRTEAGAYGVLMRLSHKAAARLRKIGYCAGAVAVHLRLLDPAGPRGHARAWSDDCRLPLCQDTPTILAAVRRLWHRRPRGPWIPFHVGVVLSELRPQHCTTPSLFEDDHTALRLSHTLDAVNAACGANALHFGAMHGSEQTAPPRIAFTQIPDFDRRVL